MNTFSNAAAKPLDFRAMLTMMRESKARQSLQDAIRDVNFEDMRRKGHYIKAERDACGEYWVVADKILKGLLEEAFGGGGGVCAPASFYGVRVVSLSAWLETGKA